MIETFLLDVLYRNENRFYEAKLFLQGFTYRIQVMIDDKEVYFEPDEAGGYRAVRLPGQKPDDFEKIDGNLLGLLAARLEALLT